MLEKKMKNLITGKSHLFIVTIFNFFVEIEK